MRLGSCGFACAFPTDVTDGESAYGRTPDRDTQRQNARLLLRVGVVERTAREEQGPAK